MDSELNDATVERMLMRFNEIPAKEKLESNASFLLEIEGLACWVLKFRNTGFIINNKELVSSLQTNATLRFTSPTAFQRSMLGYSTLDEEVAQKELKISGSEEALASFRVKWQRFQSICNLPDGPADMPIRSTRLPELDKLQPLKAGWLLKKRDIFSGWRCRYFVVHADRLEYFIDQHDPMPKVAASLEDAEVQPVKRVAVHSDGEYWGIIVETKNPKSTFRLASELTGVEGQVECATWEKVFAVARHACAQSHHIAAGAAGVGLGVGAATALEGAKTVSGAGAGETGSSDASGQLSEQGGQGERRKQRSASFAGAVDGHGQGPWAMVVSFLENASLQSWFQSVALYFHSTANVVLLAPTACLLGLVMVLVCMVYREAVMRLLRIFVVVALLVGSIFTMAIVLGDYVPAEEEDRDWRESKVGRESRSTSKVVVEATSARKMATLPREHSSASTEKTATPAIPAAVSTHTTHTTSARSPSVCLETGKPERKVDPAP
jgi:hypothetical protein